MTKSETLQLRIRELKAMHETMLHLNNECAYFDWIFLAVPDEPNEDDFESIAESDEEFKDCTKWFLKVLANYYKDGFVS